MKKKISSLCLLCLLVLPLACSAKNADTMYSLSVELNKLTTTLEGYKQLANPPASLSDKEFLDKAVAHDPELLTPFSDYILILDKNNEFVSLIMCSANATQALLQDAGCTSQSDRHLWNEGNIFPCEPLPDAFAVCP